MTTPVMQLAIAALNAGNYPEADRCVVQRLQEDRTDHRAWLIHAAAAGQRGDSNAWEALTRTALALQPGYAAAWEQLGQMSMDVSRRQAIGCLRRARAIAPEQEKFSRNLAVALQFEQPDEAVEIMKSLCRNDPGNGNDWLSLSRMCVQILEGPAGLHAARMATVLVPGDPRCHHDIARAAIDCGDWPLYAAASSRLLRLEPDSHTAVLSLGCALFDRGQDDAAEAAFRSVADRLGTVGWALQSYGDILIRQGRAEELLERLAALITKPETNKVVCVTVAADAYAALGAESTALKVLGSHQTSWSRHFTLHSTLLLKAELGRLGGRPSLAPADDRPAVAVSSLANYGRFAHQIHDYVLARLYADAIGARLETPDWPGRYVFNITDAAVSQPRPVVRHTNHLIQATLDGKVVPPLHGVDLFSPGCPVYRVRDRDRIRGWLRFRQEWDRRFALAWSALRAQGQTVIALHLRRGDLAQTNATVGYDAYARWLDEVRSVSNRPILFLASDDPAAVKAMFAAYDPVTTDDLPCHLPGLEYLFDFYVLCNADAVGLSQQSSFGQLAALLNGGARRIGRPDPRTGHVVDYDPWTC